MSPYWILHCARSPAYVSFFHCCTVSEGHLGILCERHHKVGNSNYVQGVGRRISTLNLTGYLCFCSSMQC